jgi:hypothetical protein
LEERHDRQEREKTTGATRVKVRSSSSEFQSRLDDGERPLYRVCVCVLDFWCAKGPVVVVYTVVEGKCV